MIDEQLRENILAQIETLPERLGGHIALSIAALALGVLISIPLGVWASRSKRLERVALTTAGVIQTIPSLALLAIMVFLCGMIGWLPTLIALVLYSILPMLRNTITGLEGVDPDCIEAARGVGMTERQMLYWVQLPLAAPTILAGVRTATVWVVGLATIAQPVGGTSLGNYIFTGLQTSNSTALLFGCVLSAVLALVLDALLRGMEVAAHLRSKPRAAIVVVGLLLVIVSPRLIGLVLPSSEVAHVAAHEGGESIEDTRPVVVGGKAFTEQYILTNILKGRLEGAGFEVKPHEGLGSMVVFEAMERGEVDVYVDYTGTIWATIMHRDGTQSSPETYIDVAAYLKENHGIIALGTLGFENCYAFAMPRSRAEELGIESLDDLAKHAGELKAGSDSEFFARSEWRAVQDAYGMEFGKRVEMDATLMYEAAAQGKVDVITAFTTDGRIAANDLIVLDDPRGALPPYDAMLLVSPRVARNPRMLEALRPLLNGVTTSEMRDANRMVDVDKASPSDAAEKLLRAMDR